MILFLLQPGPTSSALLLKFVAWRAAAEPAVWPGTEGLEAEKGSEEPLVGWEQGSEDSEEQDEDLEEEEEDWERPAVAQGLELQLDSEEPPS